MQTNQIGNSAKFESSVQGHELQLFRGPVEHEMPNSRDPAKIDNCLLSQALIDSFADVTGWELAQIGNEIKIVDMSASWPAKTPTAHRGRCDRFVEELSKLIR